MKKTQRKYRKMHKRKDNDSEIREDEDYSVKC